MTSILLSGLICTSIIVAIGMRVPIGIALFLGAFIGIAQLMNLDVAMSLASNLPFEFAGEWSLSAIPMFLLMGYIASNTGIATGLFTALQRVLKHLPGSLATSSVGAAAIFASASGSSVATAAAMARIAVPPMLKAGYQPGLATGCVAAAGTLGSLIPPSILMVLYGVFMQVSIGKLFIAGILPGLLTAFAFAAMITIRVWLNPSLAPKVPLDKDLSAPKDPVWPLPLLIIFVIGGIFSGIFSPTEAGAIGAAVSILIAFQSGKLSRETLLAAISQTARGTAAIFFVAIAAALFARFVSLSGLPQYLLDVFMVLTGGQPYLVLLIIAVIFILLGMFVESISLMLIMLPIIQPILSQFGFDHIWFGIITVKLLEIGLMTPPVGLNVFVVKGALGDRVTLNAIFRGVSWFVIVDCIVLALLISFPVIVTALPSLMIIN